MDYATVHRLFDYRDGDLWWKEQPGSVDMSKPAGCISGGGYRHIKINGKLRSAHRLIYLMHNPEWNFTDSSRNNQVDHRDGDRLNNNIKNLRVATNSHNQANSRKNKNNTSGHKGVSWHKTRKKWRVQVNLNGKNHYFGLFVNIEDAVTKATQMREQMHGNFANHG
jgi:hypothetical protein